MGFWKLARRNQAQREFLSCQSCSPQQPNTIFSMSTPNTPLLGECCFLFPPVSPPGKKSKAPPLATISTAGLHRTGTSLVVCLRKGAHVFEVVFPLSKKTRSPYTSILFSVRAFWLYRASQNVVTDLSSSCNEHRGIFGIQLLCTRWKAKTSGSSDSRPRSLSSGSLQIKQAA